MNIGIVIFAQVAVKKIEHEIALLEALGIVKWAWNDNRVD